jgi:hypothetical protein
MHRKLFGLLLFVCLLKIQPAFATCVDYGNYIHWQGINPQVLGAEIVLSGSLAYVAGYPQGLPGLQIVDVSNPAAPAILGGAKLQSSATGTLQPLGVAVSGSVAYVAGAYRGLFLFNVSNPSSPTQVGTVDTPGVAEDVAVSGNFAYVADYSSGLQVINVSNPASPTIVGNVDTPGDAFGVAVSGTIAYVADEYYGIQVIDISNPSAPHIVGTVDTPANAQDLVVVGTTVYVSDAQSGLQIIDASNPAAPIITGSADTPGYAWNLSVQGTKAYVADNDKGLAVIDISNPTSPTLIASKAKPGGAGAIAVTGALGVVIGGSFGLETFDPSMVTPLFLYGTLNEPMTPSLIGANGSLACVPYYASLVIIDTSNPLHPKVVNRMLLPDLGGDVVLSGTIAFATFHAPYPSNSGGLLAIDLSIPSAPAVLDTLFLPSGGDLAVSGPKAYMAVFGHFPDDAGSNKSNRLVVIDITDPQNMTVQGTVIAKGGRPAVSGTLVYLTGNQSQFLGRIDIVDVATPAQPMVIGGLDIPDWEYVSRMAISGNYGFVAVTKQNVAWDHNGVMKLELMPNPQTPRVLGITYTPGSGYGNVVVSGTTLFAAPSGVEVYLFNVADMSSIGAADVQSGVILAAGGLIYTTVGQSLLMLPDHCENAPVAVDPGPRIPEVTGLGAAFPNPGRTGSSFIPFTVSKIGMVTLRIFDATGREVRSLVNGVMDAGEQRVEWDGRNTRGERVPAGIYFYELDAPGIKAARKLVRLW